MLKAVEDNATREFLHINTYEGVEWFNRERYGDFVAWLSVFAAIGAPFVDLRSNVITDGEIERRDRLIDIVRIWTTARNTSQYRVTDLRRILGECGTGKQLEERESRIELERRGQ